LQQLWIIFTSTVDLHDRYLQR